jgi:hypothetical protein
MRIVRFYLEPWQKGGTPSPSPSLINLSPHIQRRQRPPHANDIGNIEKIPMEEREKRLRKRLKHRYPQTVKKLSTICNNVLVKNVL